jgi:hypothetical protein
MHQWDHVTVAARRTCIDTVTNMRTT